MQARDPLSSPSSDLQMKERNKDFLSALAAGPPGSSSPSAQRSDTFPPSHHRSPTSHDDVDDHDEDLHAADGLEEFHPDGEVDWKGERGIGLGFDSRPPHTSTISSYPMSGAPALGQFGTPHLNTIGQDAPREIVRVERDWVSGDVAQFHTSFPLELEGRISATLFQDLINDVNTVLLSANSFRHAVVDNVIMIASMHLSLLFSTSHFQKELVKLEKMIDNRNAEVWHPAGLSIRSPRKVAFQFLEIEYY